MLIMHVGLHKAGSTSIQAFLAENAGRLAERGVLYPEVGRRGHAHHSLTRWDSASPDWAEIIRLARSETVLLSSEDFSRFDPRPLSEVLGGTVPVRILCWARDGAEALASRYAQVVGTAKNLDGFAPMFDRSVAGGNYLAGRILERWAAAFGGSSLRVRSVHPENLAGGELIPDLLEALGLDGSAEWAQPGRRNVSPGWRALELIRSLSARIAAGDPAADLRGAKFTRTLAPQAIARAEAELGLFERGVYLTPAQAAVLIGQYNEDIGLLERLGADVRMRPMRPETVATCEIAPSADQIAPEDRARLLETAWVLLARDFMGAPPRSPT